MLLTARMLLDAQNVNSFEYTQVAQMTAGDQTDIYFQLADASKNQPGVLGSEPLGFRYMPAAGATLQVVLKSINDAKTVTRYAAQPFAQDGSIWRLTLMATDTIEGTFGLQLLLSEPAVAGSPARVTRGYVAHAVQIRSSQRSFC